VFAISGLAAQAVASDMIYTQYDRSSHNHIWKLNSSGVNVQLTDGNASDIWPSYSLDGKSIAFQRNAVGAQVWTMNSDGTGLRSVTSGAHCDEMPSFLPNGTKMLYFEQNNCGSLIPHTQIQIMNLDGSGRTVVFPPSFDTHYYIEPRMNPQGTKIVFAGDDHSDGSNQIFVVNADGTGYTQLTTQASPGVVSGDPYWSPDGTKIVMSHRDASGNINVWRMNNDGTGLTQLTNFIEPLEAGDAAYSQDGSQIWFELDNGGNGQSIPWVPASPFAMNPDGSGIGPTGISCASVNCSPR